jgi:hypothetical protein
MSGSFNVTVTSGNYSTVTVYLWNYSSSSYEAIKSFNAGTGSTTLSAPVSSLTNYVSGGSAKVLVRSVLPTRLSTATYSMSVDRISFSGKFKP